MLFRGYIFCIALFLFHTSSLGQRSIEANDTLTIYGEVSMARKVIASQLDSFPSMAIHDQIIYNHKGDIKDTLSRLRGIPLKLLMNSVTFTNTKPKELNEFYFICKASDGYRIIITWNELYNTIQGSQIYIITEINGHAIGQHPQRMLLIATGDIQTGRRYIKGLKEIEVKRL